MLKTLLQWLCLGENNRLAIDHGSGVTLRLQRCKQILKLTLFLLHDRCEQLESGAFGQCQKLVNNRLRSLLRDHLTANVAVWNTDAGPEQPEVVVNLGDGSHR